MKTRGNKVGLSVLAFVLALLLLFSCAPKATPTPAPVVATPAPVVATPTPAPVRTPTPVVATPAPVVTPTPTPAPVKPIVAKLSTWVANTHWSYLEAVDPWIKALEADSGGRLKVEVYPSQQLGAALDQYYTVRDGTADIAVVVPGYTAGLFPLSSVAELPFAVSVASAGGEALNTVHKKGYLDAEFKDVKVLYLWTGTPYQLLTAKKRVLTLEDAKGLKVRSPGGVMTEVLAALGISPNFVAAVEAYPAMQRGVIDGVAFSYAVSTPYKMQEITKYIAEVGFGVVTLGMFMNKGFWEKLPADLKAVVERNNPLGAKFWPLAYMNNDGKAFDIFIKAGTQIYSLPPAERARWIAATKHLSDKWVSDMEAKGLPGKKVYDEFLAAIAGKQ